MLLSSAALKCCPQMLLYSLLACCSSVAVSQVLRALTMLVAVSVHVALSVTGSKTQ